MKDFLLEVGCENLPSSYVRPAVEQMRLNAEELLRELRLSHDDIYATGTPRRLVLFIKNLASVQEEKIETVTGPPAAKGFDATGKPTKAALGFAKASGVPVSKLQTIATVRGDYLGFKRSLKSRKTEMLLQESLPGLIAGLKFPKVMRWESSGVRFARPIRWIVCLHGRDVVKFVIAGVSSSNVSYRVPWLNKEKIRIPSASLYLSEMKKRGIIVESEKRREKLERLAKAASAKAGLDLVDDPDLLEEISYMVEEPGVLIGEFPMEYLALPSEVIITAMKAHQRYFALRNAGNKLVPRFLAFYDGKKASRSQIKKGNERVLIARLEDAHFYWREDLKKGIQGLAEKLDAIVFVEGLGSMKDKSKRIAQVMEFIDNSQVKRAVQPDVIERLSMLAKADLASDMIKDGKEFTLLEGLIGSHYARAAGEAPEIVRAIKEQYFPRSPSDPIPKTIPGIYLNIADKIDTICGCFLAGLFPTGSQDPYGLRRQAFGLIRILESRPLVPLDGLVKKSLSVYENSGIGSEVDYADVIESLMDFLKGRVESIIKDRGVAYDVIDAVIPVAWMEPRTCIERAKSIQRTRENRAFERLIIGVKRVGNILPKGKKVYGRDWSVIQAALHESGELMKGVSFSAGLFTDEAETALLEAVRNRLGDLIRYDESSDFDRLLKILSTLGPHIDLYFDKVLVNCDDRRLRENRINFLACLFAIFSRYADFSNIVE